MYTTDDEFIYIVTTQDDINNKYDSCNIRLYYYYDLYYDVQYDFYYDSIIMSIIIMILIIHMINVI